MTSRLAPPAPVPPAPPAMMLRPGVQLSSVGKRFGAYLLEIVLVLVTLIIGWLIWSVIVWSKGQTPAKSVLGMRVVKRDTGALATWGTMFLREIVGKWLLMAVISMATVGIGALILDFMLCWDAHRQQLWDKIAGTVVVDDAAGVYA